MLKKTEEELKRVEEKIRNLEKLGVEEKDIVEYKKYTTTLKSIIKILK